MVTNGVHVFFTKAVNIDPGYRFRVFIGKTIFCNRQFFYLNCPGGIIINNSFIASGSSRCEITVGLTWSIFFVRTNSRGFNK